MAPKSKEDEDEETAVVIKYASFTAAFLAFASAVLAILAVSLVWNGTLSTELATTAGLDGTETTLTAAVTLWDFDFQLQLAPQEGSLDGQIYNLRMSWDEVCAHAGQTSANVPYCAEVTLARACVILEAIFCSFFAAMIILARRFSPLLLLAAVACGVIAVLFAFAAAGLGVISELSGLGGPGFLLLGGSILTSGMGVTAAFYAAAKAMPPPPDALEEVRRKRMTNLQESTAREKEMAAILEENVQRRRRESEEMGDAPRPVIKRIPVMLQKVIFWTQENEENGEAELPMELLQAAYQEIDEDGSGSVTLVELCEALKLCGLNASEAAAATVMQEIDKASVTANVENMNGTIDIHEFVMFFRTLEEMTRFQRKTQQRAQFLSYVLNFCFLLHIILVGVLLMIFIRMDEATGGDTYPILRNCLMAFSIVLIVLFLLVIGIPAARMTVGVQFAAFHHHYTTALQPGGKFKKQRAAQEGSAAGQGVRSAAWAEGAGTQPQVNAAKYGASYRVSKMTYDNAGEQAALQAQAPVPNPGHMSHRSHRSERSGTSHTPGSSQIPTVRPQGAIVSKTGEFVRYDPASYRNAAMNSMGARMPMSFTPMQVQNMQTSADEPGQYPGVMAITDDGR